MLPCDPSGSTREAKCQVNFGDRIDTFSRRMLSTGTLVLEDLLADWLEDARLLPGRAIISASFFRSFAAKIQLMLMPTSRKCSKICRRESIFRAFRGLCLGKH